MNLWLRFTGFHDVGAGYWVAPFVRAAIQQGIVIPTDYGSRFEPRKSDYPMTIMLARALRLSPTPDALAFNDAKEIRNKGMVGAAVQADLIGGYPDRTFRPRGVLTRAESSFGDR
ncbi:S-layer homology domain-containing protein [Ammoniphilus sp. 3BR4]|uniref:S-layer homology domain-containing protein n=1 Tax=Ammoniphilus sp. 3BR4 TaxID=3158265 RepID=UPI0034679AE5